MVWSMDKEATMPLYAPMYQSRIMAASSEHWKDLLD
jgi:hypothetical protein